MDVRRRPLPADCRVILTPKMAVTFQRQLDCAFKIRSRG